MTRTLIIFFLLAMALPLALVMAQEEISQDPIVIPTPTGNPASPGQPGGGNPPPFQTTQEPGTNPFNPNPGGQPGNQPPFQTTQEPGANPFNPDTQPQQPGGNPFEPPQDTEAEGANPFAQPETTAVPEPTAEPTAELPTDGSTEIMVAVRSDLELLAGTVLTGERPAGWNGSNDFTDPELPLLTRVDLELLAGTLLGAEVRPEGWFGAIASSPFAIARDIRHDLELLADAVLEAGVRPDGWMGDDPIMRCDRSTQALVRFLRNNNVYELQVDPAAPDFCQQAALEVSRFAEVNLLANPANGNQMLAGGAVAIPGAATVTEDFAVGFLDRGAGRRIGRLPVGTDVTPVGRSAAQFSRMMLVQGEGFQVFVEQGVTSVDEATFRELPDIDTFTFETFCTADWCEGS